MFERYAPEIQSALEAGRSAPSAHNTQPWIFRVRGRTIEIGWDKSRELSAGDPRFRYLFTGLGAAAESMSVAASGAGFESTVTLANAPNSDMAASVTISETQGAPKDQVLSEALSRRVTTRLPFRPDPVPGSMLEALHVEAQGLRCNLSIVTDASAIKRLAKTIGDATAKNFERWDVYREFYGWVRLRRDDPNYSRDGLSLDSLAPNWLFRKMAPCVMPPVRMKIIKRLRLHRIVANSQRDLARKAPAFGLITASGDTSADFFEGGRAMQRVWLRATELGLKVHPMTAAMDNEEIRSDLASVFGAQAGDPMIVSFRLGFGPESPRSVRLPIDELISGESSE